MNSSTMPKVLYSRLSSPRATMMVVRKLPNETTPWSNIGQKPFRLARTTRSDALANRKLLRDNGGAACDINSSSGAEGGNKLLPVLSAGTGRINSLGWVIGLILGVDIGQS